jgi:hypothetical protein
MLEVSRLDGIALESLAAIADIEQEFLGAGLADSDFIKAHSVRHLDLHVEECFKG